MVLNDFLKKLFDAKEWIQLNDMDLWILILHFIYFILFLIIIIRTSKLYLAQQSAPKICKK